MADQIKSWNPKHYILAALGGTLAATAVVIIVSVILHPAGVQFSVIHASRSPSSDGTSTYLNLTIAANNTSQRRAKVKYQSVFVNMKNVSTWSIHARVDTALPQEYLPAQNVTSFKASAVLVGGDWLSSFAGRINTSGLTVTVTAQVRFKIWVTPTRLYDVEVSCPHVLFSDHQQSSNSTAPPSVSYCA